MADIVDAIPRAQLLRVLKAALPEGHRIDDTAKIAVSKASTVFVMCATCYALDAAKSNKRSTISKADVLAAIEEMGFEHFLPQLESVSRRRPKQAAAKKPEDIGTHNTLDGQGDEPAEHLVVPDADDNLFEEPAAPPSPDRGISLDNVRIDLSVSF